MMLEQTGHDRNYAVKRIEVKLGLGFNSTKWQHDIAITKENVIFTVGSIGYLW